MEPKAKVKVYFTPQESPDAIVGRLKSDGTFFIFRQRPIRENVFSRDELLMPVTSTDDSIEFDCPQSKVSGLTQGYSFVEVEIE
jgi:hypothetical protein